MLIANNNISLVEKLIVFSLNTFYIFVLKTVSITSFRTSSYYWIIVHHTVKLMETEKYFPLRKGLYLKSCYALRRSFIKLTYVISFSHTYFMLSRSLCPTRICFVRVFKAQMFSKIVSRVRSPWLLAFSLMCCFDLFRFCPDPYRCDAITVRFGFSGSMQRAPAYCTGTRKRRIFHFFRFFRKKN